MAQRVDFNTDDFDIVVTQKGARVAYEQAMICQCLSKDSNQPDFMCPYCHGSGFRYFPPQNIRVLVTSFQSTLDLETLGNREPGTAYGTPTSDIVMGYRDRLTFTDFKCKFSETISFPEELGGVSTETYRNIKSVIALVKDNHIFEQCVDFDVSEDTYHIIWKSEDYDASGLQMGILYYTTPRYLVTDILHELRATYIVKGHPSEKFTELPKQYKLQREEFVYEVDKPVKNEEDSSSEETAGSNTESTAVDGYDEWSRDSG
jgi:hypothetical protein